MKKHFQITRSDGRSNGQVVLDLVSGRDPGTVFSYEELIDALSADTDHRYTKHDVQLIVTASCPRMLKEQARTLHNIRNVGYRLAPAEYHVTIANHRKDRADKQLLRGLQVLQHVRWDEMDQNQRLAHEGQLIVAGALYQQMRALERRQSAVEIAIRQVRVPQPIAIA